MTIAEEINQALQQLGYKLPNPTIVQISINRFEVSQDGEYIGIWDCQKHTFVD